MAGKYDDLARVILQNVGGRENIAGLTHCVTRLRFTLKDELKANTDILKNTEGIVTVIQSGGQYMVVIGNHVPAVYEAVLTVGQLENLRKKPEEPSGERGGKKNLFESFIDIVTGVVAPYLGILCACGILKGLLALFTAFGVLSQTGGTYNILYSLADAAFYFLPIMLGFTAARKFGIPELEGMLIGAALLYPTLLAGSGADISNLFGIPVRMPASGDYTSSVVPIIAAVAFAAFLEKRYKKYIPDTIKIFSVPLVTTTVTFVLTMFVIGPVASGLSDMIAAFFHAIYDFSPLLMGLTVGLFWQVLVMFGLHWAIIPMMINNVATIGYDVTMVGMMGTTFAQTGAVIGIMLRTRDKKIKSLCPPAIISGVVGVTEPAIYGITLPKKAPFIRTCIIGALGGAAMMLAGVKYYTSPGLGIFGYTACINLNTGDISGMYASILISIVCLALGIVGELLFYRDSESVVAQGSQPLEAGRSVKDYEENGDIFAPLRGRIVELSNVEDEAFSSGAMGKGVAIIPEEGKLYAPADGEITTFFPTGHAIGMQTENGVELLMHVGMDTVNMNGDGFVPKVEQGAKVKKGQLLLEFDIGKIKAAGYSVTTPIIVTNTEEYMDVVPQLNTSRINYGEKLIMIL